VLGAQASPPAQVQIEGVEAKASRRGRLRSDKSNYESVDTSLKINVVFNNLIELERSLVLGAQASPPALPRI